MEDYTLEFTPILMGSTNRKDRFRAEYLQLWVRYQRLCAKIDKLENDETDDEPVCPLEIMREQRDIMLDYMEILEERAGIEDIDIQIVE